MCPRFAPNGKKNNFRIPKAINISPRCGEVHPLRQVVLTNAANYQFGPIAPLIITVRGLSVRGSPLLRRVPFRPLSIAMDRSMD